MLPFYDICRRRSQMSEQKGKSVKNKELKLPIPKMGFVP